MKYRTDTADMERESRQSEQDYTQAIEAEAAWLGQAYALSISPPMQAHAAKDGCPSVDQPPKMVAEMLALGARVLDCLRKISGAP